MGVVHSVFSRKPPVCEKEAEEQEDLQEYEECEVEEPASCTGEATLLPERDSQDTSEPSETPSIADDVLDKNFKFEPICAELSADEMDTEPQPTSSVKINRQTTGDSENSEKFSIIAGSGLSRDIQTPEKLFEWLQTYKLETPVTPMCDYQTPPSRLKRRVDSSLLNCTIKDFVDSPINMKALMESELEVSKCESSAADKNSPFSYLSESPKKRRMDYYSGSSSSTGTPRRRDAEHVKNIMSAANISPGLEAHTRVMNRGATPSRRLKEDQRYPKMVSSTPTFRPKDERIPTKEGLRASSRLRMPKKTNLDETLY